MNPVSEFVDEYHIYSVEEEEEEEDEEKKEEGEE